MIRDPSDGSVREKPPVKPGGASTSRRDQPAPGPDTGLRQPTRTDAQLRLEKSREWLREYHARKHNPQKPEERHVSAFED